MEEVGRRLDLDKQALRALRYGAIFHDIGKVSIPEAVLRKRGPLTAEEERLIEAMPWWASASSPGWSS